MVFLYRLRCFNYASEAYLLALTRAEHGSKLVNEQINK